MGNGLATYYKVESRRKEFHAFDGLSWHDNAARRLDNILGRFTAIDPLAEKYPDISPYASRANSPFHYVDLFGDTITVLNYGNGTEQHIALLIQTPKGEYAYYSMNGDKMFNSSPSSGSGLPYNNLGGQKFDSPEVFMASDYNNPNGSGPFNGFGYKESYTIPSTNKQDITARKVFVDRAKEGYRLIGNNCADVVNAVLEAINVNTATSAEYHSQDPLTGLDVKYDPGKSIPSILFNSIRINNPNGQYIRK